jgi:DNA polymerase III alpha subunit
MEKEASGRFFSGHPLDDYIDSIKRLNSLSIASVLEFFEDIQENQEEQEEDDLIVGTDAIHEQVREIRPQTPAEAKEDKIVIVAGIINDVNIKKTKNGDTMAFLTFEDEYSSIEVVVFPKKYRQFLDEMKVDNIIAVQGNISPGREENPKIFLNNIIKLKKNGDNSPDISVKTKEPERLSKTNVPRETNDIIENKNQDFGEIAVLYLKVPDKESVIYKKAINLIEIFDGRIEVKIYEENTKKIYSMKNPGTDLNQVCVNELKNLLGDENVKIVKKAKGI